MISVIIPTLNEERSIEKTLKNLRETSTPLEIIISDGNSKDKTAEIARKYTDKIIVYTGTERQTIAGGRNLGAKNSSGDFLLFQDADVIIPNPELFFQKIIAYFQNNPKVVAITVSRKVLKENETFGDEIVFSILNFMHFLANNILHTGIASGEFQMMRKSAFLQVGGYNEKLPAGEDYEMFSRLSKIGKTRMIRELTIFDDGRRAHKIGWPRLLSQWFKNWFYATFLKRARIKEWEPIR